MKVKDLIEFLSKQNPECDCITAIWDDGDFVFTNTIVEHGNNSSYKEDAKMTFDLNNIVIFS